jgi:hypothetical protein
LEVGAPSASNQARSPSKCKVVAGTITGKSRIPKTGNSARVPANMSSLIALFLNLIDSMTLKIDYPPVKTTHNTSKYCTPLQ